MGGGLGEEGIIESFLGPERLAEVIGIAEQQRLRGSAKVSLAPPEARVFWTRAVLEAIDCGLHELNERFPGQRSMAEPEQDPTFRDQRVPLIIKRRELIRKQREERRTIRGVLSERQHLEGETASSF